MSQASHRLAPWRPKPGARATDILARARERDARLDPNDHDIEPAYVTVDIPKSLPIHGMALTSTGRKIEHNKVVVDTQTYESNG